MNKLLFGLGASLLVTTMAHAQEAPSFTFSLPELPSTPGELKPIPDKEGIFVLQPGRYAVRELLTELAAKTGGKALFDNEFRMTNLFLYQPFEGTVPEIIKHMELFGLTVGRVGTDWVFVKREVKASPVNALRFSIPSAPQKIEPFDFNLNRTPGQNLPPDATPFEFNEDRVYHVPICGNK